MGSTGRRSALATIGVVALISGAALIASVSTAAAATPTLSATVTSSSSGATCSGTPVSGTGTGTVMTLCRNVSGGDVLGLSGAGFSPNALASDVECNTDASQPMVTLLGNYVPISCTKIAILNATATGTFTGSFTVKSGTTGPPAAGTPMCTTGSGTPATTTTIPNCTTSGDGATDAAKYPCPPTAAQQAAGDTCVLAIGDINGDRAVGAIVFAGASTGGTTTPGATTSGSSSPAASAPTSAPASQAASGSASTPTTAASAPSSASQSAPSLASTGPGPQLWLVALMGFVLLCVGAMALALVDVPRRFVAIGSILDRRSRRSPLHPGRSSAAQPNQRRASSIARGRRRLNDVPRGSLTQLARANPGRTAKRILTSSTELATRIVNLAVTATGWLLGR